MKKILMIAAIMCTGALFAQEVEPKFEQNGDVVKGTFFHDNGTVKQEGTYKDGKLDGQWVMYNDEGKKVALGEYNNGEKTGKWFFWKEDQLTEVDYSNNSIAEVTTWKNSNVVVSNE